MSYLARIAARAVTRDTKTRAVMPKGFQSHHPATMARMNKPEVEDENVSAMRGPAGRPVRRQEEEDEDENIATTRASSAGPAGSLESEEEEPDARRQSSEEREEEKEIQPMTTISRQEEIPLDETGQTAAPPSQKSLEPGAEPVSQEYSSEEEPSDLQALQRNVSSRSSLSSQQSQQSLAHVESSSDTGQSREVYAPPSLGVPDSPDGNATMNVPPHTAGGNDPRPNVIIDQLDVLIQEPEPPAGQSASRRNHNRSLRARYLRRL